jgi:hypothetical protein
MSGAPGVTPPATSVGLIVNAVVAVLLAPSIAIIEVNPKFAPEGTINVPMNVPYEFATKLPTLQLPRDAVMHAVATVPTVKELIVRLAPNP